MPTHANLPEEEQLRLEMARTDFLYGLDGTEACRNVEKLAKKYMLNIVVITRHARAWMAELESWAISNSKTYSRGSDPQTQMEHENDVMFLRKQVDALQKALSECKRVGGEEYKFVFDQWAKAQKRYSEMSGAEAALALTATVQERAATAAMDDHIARRRAKEAREDADASAPREISGTVFDITEEPKRIA